MMRLVNVAAKVADVDAAAATLAALPGLGPVREHALGGDDRFAEVTLGDARLNLFARALHDADRPEPTPPGLLHLSFAVDDLDAHLDGGWRALLVGDVRTISGTFGVRRIAFFEPLPGVCVELMEDRSGA
ncbi:hypothetical protein [Patulibacter sp. SYSU D01012]|uniref:hypothetical protein n=1 Tax=Patulibacter sp. SYSU D01012 TaxID=2817381 RepID=UPI001B3063BA|nr:hypothetical protein [Patulibacter sp. SYSU D01012]